MKTKQLRQNASRHDRLIQEHEHDPYKRRAKLPEPSFCSQCGAVYRKGRWQWAAVPEGSHEELCQACHRINDDYPAGILTLSGAFLARHRREILGLARNEEELEKGQHPLHRIMKLEEPEGGETLVITTTDIHLPRRIGEALHSAYEGELDFHYEPESYAIRVRWQRES